MPPKGGGDKTAQFWAAIQGQKQDTIRWSFSYGGINTFTRDDDGYCGIHLASKSGKVRSLESILDHIRRGIMSKGGGDTRGVKGKGGPAKKKSYEELDCKDEEFGLTALMWACKGGYYECARLLYENGCMVDIKSDEGKTALQYAKEFKREAIIQWFARGCEEEEEKETAEEFPFIDGETEGERRKRIKAIKSGQEKFSSLSKKGGDDVKKENDSDEDEDKGPGPAPQWEEIKESKSGEQHTWTCDLVCLRQQSDDKAVDPALWYCKHINNLKLRLPPKVLTELPSDLARLKSLTTLIVSHNSLKALPEDMKALKHLKNLEFTDNKVQSLPEALGTLTNLEVIDACRNTLTNVNAMASLHNLVTLKLDQNEITSLKDAMQCKKLTRLGTLSASYNKIEKLDEKMGRLGALTSLNLSNNAIKELPVELSDISEKVLVHLNLDENPLKDSKVKKILEKGRAPIKELLQHLEKEKQSGGRNKKKKAESEEEESEEEEVEQEPEPEPEPVKQQSQAGGGGGKNKKKGGGGGGGGKGKGGGSNMTDAQKEAARAAAMAKLGMPPPPSKSAPAAAPAAEMAALSVKEEELDLGDECEEDDMADFYTAAPDSEESEDDLDDFLTDKPKEEWGVDADRDKRIAKELEQRKKAAASVSKEKALAKKEHEDWLASMDDETRQRYVANEERKQRAAEEAMREEEVEMQRRRLEDAKRRAGASGDAGPADSGKAAPKNDKIELKWAWSSEGGGKLVAEPIERKGPKKPIREIQLRFPKKKVGVIIGKAGVNIKIIQGKSRAKVNICKPKAGEEDDDETLVTIKGETCQIDKACEVINQVFAQFSAAMKAKRAAIGK